VISVPCHAGRDPEVFSCNPRPPVEFGAVGIDIVVRILGKHPALTPFQVKTVLRALSANVQR
jgi:hypothetical protein